MRTGRREPFTPVGREGHGWASKRRFPQRGKRRFDAHPCPSRPTGVKGSRLPVLMLQPARPDFTRLFVDPRYNLVARMQITSDNVHGSAPFSANLGPYITKFTDDLEPTPLSNQTLASRRESAAFPLERPAVLGFD